MTTKEEKTVESSVKKDLPTIDIKWKQYVLVKDRVVAFNELYPLWSIRTERFNEWDMEIVKATVIPNVDIPERYFTWWSQAKWSDKKSMVNATAALENCETSAVWRALAFLWLWIVDSIASADEMRKAESASNTPKEKTEFNEEDFERLKQKKDYVKKFKDSVELLKDMEKYYIVSTEWRMKVWELFVDIAHEWEELDWPFH